MDRRKIVTNFTGIVTTLFFIFGMSAQAQTMVASNKVTISYEVRKVSGLNTNVSEFCPVIFGNKLIYTSNREYNLNNWGEDSWNKNGFINIYAAEIMNTLSDSAVLGPSKIFSYKLMTDDHSGPICFASNGSEAFLTQVSHASGKLFGKQTFKPQLYRATMENKRWKIVERLSVNDPEYSFGHPCLIENDQVLIFVSDRPGGKGGKDLFWVERKGEAWSEPVPLGDSLNSSGDEMFPTYHDGKLYFASNGHGGQGGLDMFYSELKDGKWSAPKNLGDNINSTADDFGIVFNKNSTGFFTSNRENGTGSDDIYFFREIKSVTVESKEIAGQFEFKMIDGELPPDLEVVLVDDEGQIVYRTKLDEDGKFKFINIPGDKSYTIKLVGMDGEEMVLTVYGDGQDAVLLSNENGEFVYRKIKGENIGTLEFMDEYDVDLETNTARFRGQFIFEKIMGEYPADIEVYLVDDEGQIVYRTKTDKYGNFQFKNIAADRNFIVKIAEQGDDMTLLIFNSDYNIVSQLNKNEKGEFVFRKLSGEYGSDIMKMLAEEGELTFRNLTMRIVGEFVYKHISGEDLDSLEFEVLNANMEIIGRGVTDSKGKFRLIHIPYEDEILFKLPEDSPWLDKDIGLNILDKSHDIEVILEKDETGLFRFRFIKHEDTYLDTIAIADTFDIAAPPTSNIVDLKNVYYDKGKYRIDKAGLENLKYVAQLMNNDHRLKIHVGGHTSATATEEFNMALSKKRMQRVKQFLMDNGVESERIIGKYFGEEKLAKKCANPEDCTEAEHRLNRRTELQLFY